MKGRAPLPSVIIIVITIIFWKWSCRCCLSMRWSQAPSRETSVSSCSPPPPEAAQGQENALVPPVMGPQELCRPPSNPGRGVRGPAAFVCWPVFCASILPSSIWGQQPRYRCPTWVGSRRQRAFLSEFHGLIRCWGLFPPGTWKPSFVSCPRVRLSPVIWLQASVCLQQDLLRGGREGRRGRGEEGKSSLKAIFGVRDANSLLPLSRNQAPHKDSPPQISSIRCEMPRFHPAVSALSSCSKVRSDAEPLLRLLNQQELQKIILETLKMHFLFLGGGVWHHLQ